jgi:purine-cytosine permease-like protein
MSNFQHRWENYKLVLEKRAIDHPFQWVAVTIAFSFVAGLNTAYALLGGHFLRHFSIAVAVYAVATSYICVAIFGVTLVRALRHHQNRADTTKH